MKRPRRRFRPLLPHMTGLFELERLADETVDLAAQMRATVAELRRQEAERPRTQRAGDRDDAD